VEGLELELVTKENYGTNNRTVKKVDFNGIEQENIDQYNV